MAPPTLEELAGAINTALDAYQRFNEAFEQFKRNSANLKAVALAIKEFFPIGDRVALLLPQFSREHLEPMNDIIISFTIEHCRFNNSITEFRNSLTIYQRLRVGYILS